MEPDHLIAAGTMDRQLLAESLLEHYFAVIHRLAFSILQDAAAADDVAQETFISALRHFDRYQSETSMKAWLSAIATNLCRDRLRRRKTRERLDRLWLGDQTRHDVVTRSAEDSQLQREAGATLWAAVNRLDEKHRLPVIMRYANGYSIREIADVLQIPVGTVHSRLHHACRTLAYSLQNTETEALLRELFNE